MYAVFRSGGKQYRAAKGDLLRVEKLDAAPGDKVEFDQVLLVGEGSDVSVGAPGVLFRNGMGAQKGGNDVDGMGAIQLGAIGTPGSFILEDDPNLSGMLKGQFAVTISDFCESQPATPVIANGVPSSFPEFQTRHFHLRSDAERTIGGLAGLTRAAVEADVSSFPFMEDQFVPVDLCY